MLIFVHGGVKVYRGSAAAARHYVEADRGRADDYYLAEGTGVAERYTVTAEGAVCAQVPLAGGAYEAWVAGLDPETGAPKGRLRNDENAVRFVEVVVNGPKSWSLAAELHPDISTAFDAAQDAAAQQIIAWLGQHSTTRIGPRGAQIQVPVSGIDAAVVRHYTSRAGDPHRHLHLQINARVHAEGRWRGLHTVGVRDSIEALNGIGHAAVMTDPGFRSALSKHGFTLDPDTGEVTQLERFVGAFSARAAQIGRHLETYEAQWRDANPGREPGPTLRRGWDRRAWAEARPDKIVPADGTELTARWVAELRELGHHELPATPLEATSAGQIDREQTVTQVLSRLAGKRSGWNAADIRGEVEQAVTRSNLVTDALVRAELAEDLTARTLSRCVPLLERPRLPEHIRSLTSPEVLAVEADLTARFAARAERSPDHDPTAPGPSASATARSPDRTQTAAAPGEFMAAERLDQAQSRAVELLTGPHRLVVVEGAAGAGKTSTLAAARAALEAQGRRLVVATPTLRAAKAAQAELAAPASSAAALVFQHGFRWDAHGAWTRLKPGQHDPATGRRFAGPALDVQLHRGDVLLVDEAGMLDQDTARALLTVADAYEARVALVGDRHQLAAVGRGGVLELATRWAPREAQLTLDRVHRFTRLDTGPDGADTLVPDTEYARLSLAMRTGDDPGAVFDTLLARGQVAVHADDATRTATLAQLAAAAWTGTADGQTAVIADTRPQVADLNAAIRARLVRAGQADDRLVVTTAAGQRIGAGDRVATRRNDPTLGVANRDEWTVVDVDVDGGLTVAGEHGTRILPIGYVTQQVELAYASTVHAVQGATVIQSHLVLGEHTSGSAAYVAMSRGRESNTVHFVADDVAAAREQWIATFARDRADLGPAHAAAQAAREAERYATGRPLPELLDALRDAWTKEQDALDLLGKAKPAAAALREIVAIRAERDTTIPALRQTARDARQTAASCDVRLQRASVAYEQVASQIREAVLADWDAQRPVATLAAQTVEAGTGRFGHHRARVAAAQQQLTDWADFWRPYLPSLPTDPEMLVRAALSYDDRPARTDAFDRYAHERADALHTEHAAARVAAEQAQSVVRQADTAYGNARQHYFELLNRRGRLARDPDPAGTLHSLEHDLEIVRRGADTARETISALEHDPTLRSAPPDTLTGERDRWTRDRRRTRDEAERAAALAAAAADRAAYVHLGLRSGTEFPTPLATQPHRLPDGPGFGR